MKKPLKQANTQALRNNISLVTYLVQNKLVKSRALAELAAEQFGMPLMDLGSIDKEVNPKIWSAKN